MAELRDDIQQSLGSAYTIERELGGGGMSRVFVAHDTALRRDVVVKILPPDLIAGVNVERFRREILLAAGLQHPHIVPVLSSGEMDGVPWFTMPFVQGESLRQRLARGPLPITEAVNVLREIAKALAYAHERGIVHRDIKPDNVLLTGGTAVVTDFGIAKALSASRTGETGHETRNSLTQVGMSIGTPMYMAPEQAAADPSTDARADLYSFGCVAYELLTGRPPFVGLPPQRLLAAHMSERPIDVANLRRDTPPLLAELVMHCLEKDPAKRPASAADVVRLLEVATTTSGSGTATSAVLLGGRVRLRVALAVWVAIFFASWILAKAAIVGIGLPSWVLPGALIVAGLGLPVILLTAYVQRTAHKALTVTPTLTPGGTRASQGTMMTLAVKASPHVSWKRTVRGGFIAFGAFVLIIGAFMVMRAFGIGPAGSLLASGRISAREPILVSDFSVKQGDSTLAGVVSEALRASLSQSTAITLVPPATVTAALQRMQRPGARMDLALARDVAQREGVRAIIGGEVAQLGSGYVVTVRLITADSGVTLATVQKAVDGTKELITATDAIGRELRGKIGESLKSVQNAPSLAQVTTPSIEALRLYSEGNRAYEVGDSKASIPLLIQAVTIDPGFAMAWRKLGNVYNAVGYSREAADSALRRAYLSRDRLTARERLATEGSYFGTGPGHDRAKAIAAYEQMLATGGPSDSVIALNNLAIMLGTRRQDAREDSLLTTMSGRFHNILAYVNLMATSAAQLDSAREAKWYLDGRKAFPAQSSTIELQAIHGDALAAMGAYAQASVYADSVIKSGTSSRQAEAWALRSGIAGVRGQPAAMVSAAVGMRASDPSQRYVGSALIDSAMLSMYDIATLDQPARAVRRLDAALAATPTATVAPSNRDYGLLATVYARAGRVDRARDVMAMRTRELHDTTQLRSEEPMVHRVTGEIALASNDPKTAIREFWKGDSLPDGPTDDQCAACTYLTVARAWDKASVPDSAIAYYEKMLTTGAVFRLSQFDYYGRTPAIRRLGELYEAKSDRAKAAHYYQQFVDLWKNAEPELQPQVAEIRKRLARLSDTEKR